MAEGPQPVIAIVICAVARPVTQESLLVVMFLMTAVVRTTHMRHPLQGATA